MSLFGADFGLEASSNHFPPKMCQAITGIRYRDTIIQFFCALQDMDMDDTWFQQDGATCHTVQKIIRLLHELFFDRVIFRFIN